MAASAEANIGRFTPTHNIVEPVYCGSCHPDQVRELNETTHLAFFSGELYSIAQKALTGTDIRFTDEQAISGACMMCHNTWNNRDNIYIAGYKMSNQADGSYQLIYNDMTYSRDGTVTMYDVPVNGINTVRLGTKVTVLKVLVQKGPASLPPGSVLNAPADYILNGTTGIDLVRSANNNIQILKNLDGLIKIIYKVVDPTTSTVTYKQMWGDLSAISPSTGYVYNDIKGENTCTNLEKGSCHVISSAIAYALAAEKINGQNNGPDGKSILFQHNMAYTSADYQARQVKMCGVCHTQKLPPMTSEGEPIRVSASDWVHASEQCVKCHSHAGIENDKS